MLFISHTPTWGVIQVYSGSTPCDYNAIDFDNSHIGMLCAHHANRRLLMSCNSNMLGVCDIIRFTTQVFMLLSSG